MEESILLAPYLNKHSNHCFISLPQSYKVIYTRNIEPNDTNAGIVEISWENVKGYVQTVFCTWIGGICSKNCIELPFAFAECINLAQDLTEDLNLLVKTRIVQEKLSIARRIDIEPYLSDDWELIQLHAARLENVILRQIAIVNDRQIFPIWISSQIMIRVLVILHEREFARISDETEFVVSPKERKATTRTGFDSELFYKASQPLRVQTTCNIENLEANADTVCYVHPDTLLTFDGILSPSIIAKKTPIQPPLVSIWKHDITNETERPAEKPMAIAILKCEESVFPNRILLSNTLRFTLSLQNDICPVQLRILRVPSLTPSLLRLCIRPLSQRTYDDSEIDNTRESVLQHFREHQKTLLLYNGLRCSLHLASFGQCLLEVEAAFPEDYALTSKQKELITQAPIGALPKFALLYQVLDWVIVNMDIKLVKNQSTTQQQFLGAKSEANELINLNSLCRLFPAYQSLIDLCDKIFSIDRAYARVCLCASSSSTILLHGDQNIEMTWLARTLLRDLSSRKIHVHGVFLDCRELRGLKMQTLKDKLNNVWKEARSQAPSLIVLDHMNAIVPCDCEANSNINAQSLQIAHHLNFLMETYRDQELCYLRQLHKSMEKEQLNIQSHSLPPTASKKLIECIGYAMLSKTIACIELAPSKDELNGYLSQSNFFNSFVEHGKLGEEERKSLLREMLSEKCRTGLELSHQSARWILRPSVDLVDAAQSTNKFNLQDLLNACDRAIHRAIARQIPQVRHIGSEDVTAENPNEIAVTTDDFKNAIEKCIPSSISDTKLYKGSVQWDHIGGLQYAKKVVRETIEYPTRYHRLYKQAPIKLPIGVLLYGPPGCGKTMLANAVASECGLNFISVKGPEVLNKYIGASEESIRLLFRQAMAASPCVLFLDEFESIAPRRGGETTGVTDRLVNQLLTFLDGVESLKGVYVMAASSRPDMIDTALLRPGRIDKAVYCGFPDMMERSDILQAVAKKHRISKEAHDFLQEIARSPSSENFSGADLQAIFSTAQLKLVHESIDIARRAKHSQEANLIRENASIELWHIKAAFAATRSSTSHDSRMQYEVLYENFSSKGTRQFKLATVDASASVQKLQDKHPQRIALG